VYLLGSLKLGFRSLKLAGKVYTFLAAKVLNILQRPAHGVFHAACIHSEI